MTNLENYIIPIGPVTCKDQGSMGQMSTTKVRKCKKKFCYMDTKKWPRMCLRIKNFYETNLVWVPEKSKNNF